MILVNADKGKTIVIINSDEYSKKVQTFRTDSNFHLVQKDLTVKYQQLIQKTLLQCSLLIDKKKINYLIQKKPLPPTLKAQLKLWRYIGHNNPQSAYAQHILNNRHKYGPINNTVCLLKHINKTKVLLPYRQLYIQTHQHHKQLISEQSTGEHIPIYQLLHDTFHTSLATRPADQYPPATE